MASIVERRRSSGVLRRRYADGASRVTNAQGTSPRPATRRRTRCACRQVPSGTINVTGRGPSQKSASGRRVGMREQQHGIAMLCPDGRRRRLIGRPANDRAAVGEAPQRETTGVARLLGLGVVEDDQDTGSGRDAGDRDRRGRRSRADGTRDSGVPPDPRPSGCRGCASAAGAQSPRLCRTMGVSRLTSPLVRYRIPSV